ncbi:MAG: hypothetical protein KJ811_05145, partial [Candidatus Margulisbacteria bacterium]|nr:hypothetical protein [Candidatus Margulisiibacteriota bacterium]
EKKPRGLSLILKGGERKGVTFSWAEGEVRLERKEEGGQRTIKFTDSAGKSREFEWKVDGYEEVKAGVVTPRMLEELEATLAQGRYRELLENLPPDLRLDFLLMLFGRSFNEAALLEFSRQLDEGTSLLAGLTETDDVVKTATTTGGAKTKPKDPRQELEEFEAAVASVTVPSQSLSDVLSIIQIKYRQQLLGVHNFDLAAALAEVERKLAAVADPASLLGQVLNNTAEYLRSDFTVKGLAKKVELKSHQQLGVRFLLDHPQALLADEMGSGKTLESLAVAVNADCEKVVIICRPSGRSIWQSEIEDKLARDEDRSLMVVRSGRGMQRAKDKRFVIINYEYARVHVDEIQALNPDMVILDEAHALCHKDSQQSRKIRNLEAPRKIAVTGTPILNESRELWPILHFLLPKEFPTAEGFAQNYTQNLLHRALLNNRLREIMIRRKMGDYSVNLPPLIEKSIKVAMTSEQEQVYLEIIDDPVRWAHGQGKRFSHLLLVSWLLHVADDLALLKMGEVGSGGKYGKVAEIVAAEPEKQRLVFVRNHLIMDHLADILPDARVIKGNTDHVEREAIIGDYKEGRIKTIIMSYRLGGESYNLPETDEIILFDQPWNTPQKQQAIYRGYRLNRDKDKILTVLSIISQGSIDEDIVSLQAGKWREFREVVEGEKDRTLNEQNVNRLLEMTKNRRLAQVVGEAYLDEVPANLVTDEFRLAIGR